jgi:general secretion pathway protein L
MASAPAQSLFSSFYAWWREELEGLLPARSAEASKSKARIVLAIAGNELYLRPAASAALRKSAEATTRMPVADMLSHLADLERSGRLRGPVRISVPASAAFVRTLTVPAAARRGLERLLALELERSTPFKPNDVLSAFEVDTAASQSGHLAVRHLLVKLKPVAAVADAVEELGIEVERVELDRPGTAPLALSCSSGMQTPARRKKRWTGFLSLLLLALTGLLFASAAITAVDKHRSALETLEAENAKLRAAVIRRDAAASKAQAAVASIAAYSRLAGATVSRAALLEEISRILPDSAWVTDLRIDGATASVTGQAKSAAALLPLFESSKYFVDATFSSPVTFDPQEEKERYSIRARIRGGDADSEAAVRSNSGAE